MHRLMANTLVLAGTGGCSPAEFLGAGVTHYTKCMPAHSTHPHTGIRRRAVLTLAAGGMILPLLSACGGSGRVQLNALGQEHANPRNQGDVNEALTELEQTTNSVISLAVYNHAKDSLFIHRGDAWTYEASIVKVPIALTLLRLAAFQQRELTDYERGLIQRSISYSDNDATIEIFGIFGSLDGSAPDSLKSAESLNKTYELLGVSQTRSEGTWGNNRTWAEDQVAAIRSIVNTVEWVNATDAQFLLESMTPMDASQTWGVGGQQGGQILGEDITEIVVKNGWLQDDTGTWHVNSVGMIRTHNNTYSIAALSKGFADQQKGYHTLTEAVHIFCDKGD